MTYTVKRDGLDLGVYTEEGISRQLETGNLLPTDLAFLETQQKWVELSTLAKDAGVEYEDHAAFAQKLENETPIAFVTPALIATNVVVVLCMAVTGVSVLTPTNGDLIRWGADFGPLTLHGQWWRLLMAAFVHVGLMHIAFNMWALFSGGMFAERLFGNSGFLTLYLLAAIGGNLASLWWQPVTVAAGASGAVFGVYGGLLAILLMQRESIPPDTRTSLSTNALIFIGYNVLYGLRDSHIDMAAHVGGLLTGFIAGCALAFRANPGTPGNSRLRRNLAVAAVGLVAAVFIGRSLKAGESIQTEAYATEFSGKSLTIGKQDLIAYSGAATESDAKQLGATMTGLGFLRDKGGLVLYHRDPGGAVVSLIVNERAWVDPELASTFDSIGRLLSLTLNAPLKLRLLNDKREMKKEFVFEAPTPIKTGRSHRSGPDLRTGLSKPGATDWT